MVVVALDPLGNRPGLCRSGLEVAVSCAPVARHLYGLRICFQVQRLERSQPCRTRSWWREPAVQGSVGIVPLRRVLCAGLASVSVSVELCRRPEHAVRVFAFGRHPEISVTVVGVGSMHRDPNVSSSPREQPSGPLLLPAGRHPAVLIASINLGTHKAEWLGSGKTVRQHLFCWETGVSRPDGTHHVVSEKYNVFRSLDSHLMNMLGGWRGSRVFDSGPARLETLVGAVALLTIRHRVSRYNKPFAYLVGVESHGSGDRPTPFPTFGPLVYQIRDGCPPEFPWRPFAGGIPAHEYIERSRERQRVRNPAARRARAQGSWSPP